ncbi:MAG: hypothetical protein ICV58_08085 [Rubrobacteraceae bacterium]|nr:hypothetical protein [Rubrobacteraceae bacterium]
MKTNGEWELYSYKHMTDDGFAPTPPFDNHGRPIQGELSLRGCKEDIETLAQPGDWIVGVVPQKIRKLSFAMEVTRRDPSGRGVYSAWGHWWFWGANMVTIPPEVGHITEVKRGYYAPENENFKHAFVEWLVNNSLYPPGFYGYPRHWQGFVPDECQHELNTRRSRKGVA